MLNVKREKEREGERGEKIESKAHACFYCFSVNKPYCLVKKKKLFWSLVIQAVRLRYHLPEGS